MGLGATESAGNRSWDNTALPSGVGWGQPGELWVSKAGVVQFCESWLLCFYTCCSVGHSRSIKEPSWLLTLEHTCVHTHTHAHPGAHTHTQSTSQPGPGLTWSQNNPSAVSKVRDPRLVSMVVGGSQTQVHPGPRQTT